MDMTDAVFETLADPVRRRLLDVLRGGERSVGDLVAAVPIRQSGVSRHLGILERNGFVQARRDGQRRLYSLRPEPFRELEGWAAAYRAHWEARLDRLTAALEARADPDPEEPAG